MKNVWVINHYIHTPHNGTLTRHYMFEPYLKEHGYNTTLITASTVHNSNINISDKGKPYKFVNVDGRQFVYVKTPNYNGNGLSRVGNIFSYYIKIKAVTRKFRDRPDIIYASSPHPLACLAALQIAKRYKVPCVCEIRDLWPESIVQYRGFSSKNPAIVFLRKLEKYIYTKCDALVFTMPGTYAYIEAQNWQTCIPENKIFSVNNGIELTSFMRNATENVQPDKLLDSDEYFKIVYCGSIREVNNLLSLINPVWEMKKRGYNNVVLIIYGRGDKEDGLIEYCKTNGIDNVFFRGFVDKSLIPSVVSRADVNVVCGKRTDLGKYCGCSWNKLSEYFAAGKPVVTNVIVRDDFITANQCGFVAQDGSMEEMVDLLCKIYDMPRDEYDTMCKNARNAAQEFDYSVLTDKLITAFEYAEQNYRKVKGYSE